MKTSYVLTLPDSQAILETVGGKGMSLAKMIRAGFPVPNGFHITTEAYRAFVDANNLQAKIIAALKDVDASLPASLETADVTPMENPYAAGLGFCVQMDKGDFIGRDALLKVKEEGVKRKLCTLVLEGEDYQTIYGGEAVYSDGKVISRVRSGGYGYTVKRNIIFAYLPVELAKTGTRLEVDVFDAVHPVEGGPMVLVDPKGERLRM